MKLCKHFHSTFKSEKGKNLAQTMHWQFAGFTALARRELPELVKTKLPISRETFAITRQLGKEARS